MIANVALIILLIFVFLQDWKERKIFIGLPVLIFGVAFYKSFHILSLYEIVINALFFIFVFLILVLVQIVKQKEFKNPFEHYFGLGDFLFYLAITPLFFLRQYAIFFIVSLLFSVLLFFGLRKFSKEKNTVPLAGYAGIALIVFLIINLFVANHSVNLCL